MNAIPAASRTHAGWATMGLFALSLLSVVLSACGENEPSDAALAAGPASPGAGSAGARAGAVGTQPTKPDRCLPLPPHTAKDASLFGECSYLCEIGFADCDGELSNGCEVSLAEPDACKQCHAMGCLQPEACGLSKPECQNFDGPYAYITTGSDPDNSALRSLALGKVSGDVIASGAVNLKDTPQLSWPGYSGSTFSWTIGANPEVHWTARGPDIDAQSGAADVRRFGDRLYIIDTHANEGELVPSAVLIVADLDGTVLWSKRIGDGVAKLCAHHVAADEQNNVYLAYSVCESEETGEDYVLEGESYDSDDGDLIAAFDAAGSPRWTKLVFPDGNKWVDGDVCENGIEAELVGLVVAGGRLFGANEVCLAEVDTSSGVVKAAQKLQVPTDDYAGLRADAAGNLYVSSTAHAGEVLLVPNAAPPGFSGGHPGGSAAFVSKYRSDLTHVWSRALAHHGTYDGVEKVDPWFRGFDVSPSGAGMLVGRAGTVLEKQSFVVAFDTAGNITGAAKFKLNYDVGEIVMDAEGTAYVGGLVTRSENDPSGVLVQAVKFE